MVRVLWELMAHAPLNIVEHTTLALKLNEVNCIADFIVVNMTVEGILGIDLIKKHHCNIDIFK